MLLWIGMWSIMGFGFRVEAEAEVKVKVEASSDVFARSASKLAFRCSSTRSFAAYSWKSLPIPN